MKTVIKTITIISVLLFLATTGLFAAGKKEQTKEASKTITTKALTFAHLGSEKTAYHQGALKFAEKLKELSNGRFTMTIYPNGQLGDEGQLFEQQMAGQLDFSIVNPGKIVEFAQVAAIFSFPFLFKDVDQWNNILGGEIGKEVSEKIYKQSDVKVLGYFGGGIRMINSRIPLNNLESIKGMKLRTNQTPPVLAAWKALGAIPVPYAYKEVYTGLQTGAIDGILNEPEWVEIMKFYEVAPYIGLSKHEITVRFFTVSGKLWGKLNSTDKKIFQEAADYASAFAREYQVKVDTAALERIKSKGAELIPLDRKKMEETVRQPLENVAKNLGYDDIYRKIKAAQ